MKTTIERTLSGMNDIYFPWVGILKYFNNIEFTCQVLS